jgi:hypothetical protein
MRQDLACALAASAQKSSVKMREAIALGIFKLPIPRLPNRKIS